MRTSATTLVTEAKSQLALSDSLLKMLRCLRRGPDRRRRKRFRGDSCTTVRHTLRGLELLCHWIYLAMASICRLLARYNLKLEHFQRWLFF